MTTPSCNCPLAWHNISKSFHCKYVQAGLALGAVGYLGMKLKAMRTKAALKAEQRKFKENVVYLYAFPRCATVNQFSPACQKLECFLRLAKIPYVAIPTMDTSVSPSDRVPCIVYNGQTMTDSQIIIEFLTKEFNIMLDADLTHEQQRDSFALRRIVEMSGWVSNERAFIVDHPEVLRKILKVDFKTPSIMVGFIAGGIRKDIIKYLNIHGNGDLPDEFYREEFLRDIKAVESYLQKAKGFAVSDKPSTIDAILFGFLESLFLEAAAGVTCEAIQYAVNSTTIADYYNRMKTLVFPDFAEITKDGSQKGPQEFFTVGAVSA